MPFQGVAKVKQIKEMSYEQSVVGLEKKGAWADSRELLMGVLQLGMCWGNAGYDRDYFRLRKLLENKEKLGGWVSSVHILYT